ncbi:MAG TPA: plastocyanin/azurin family copper-binding protein [Symbiobacteriaceae bacterium]|nr:plastocyanin/azurin family copper-binding protein [Symbiobacteriaceae bacterium]
MLKKVTVGIAALGLVAALAGCGGGASKPKEGAKPAAGGETVVELKGTKFGQSKLEVKAGATVKWVNHDNVDHSIWEGVPDSGQHLIKSEDISNGGEVKYTFDKAGTYEVFCNTASHHLIGMKMQVVVK